MTAGRPLLIFTLLLAAITLSALSAPDPASASPQGGMSRVFWEGGENKSRRSPRQIPPQSKPQLPLPSDAQSSRSVKAGMQIVSGAASLAPQRTNMLGPEDWRLKIRAAAVTNTDMVLLGDIATPLGAIAPEMWNSLKTTELWPAPPDEGKPLQVNRSRLSQALHQSLGKETAGRCILPTSLVIQRGGVVFLEDDLRSYVVKSLTPQLTAMPGEAELHDFRLPEYIFLAHGGQRVQLEPGKLAPGRITLRFAVQEADGSTLRRIAGMANLLLWVTVPAAAHPLNKGEGLTPQGVTFMRVNAAQLRELPWDSQGGPWRMTRSVASGEPILQSDLVSELVIRRGNVISIIYSRGNVYMSTRGEALADGEPGATIAVRNLQTKKQVYGVVRDGNTVEIH